MKITRRSVLAVLLFCSIGTWLCAAGPGATLPCEPENYSLIEEGLYMGGATAEPPPGTRAVLNLCEMKDRYECEIHVWDPIRDSAPAPSVAWLKEKVAFIATQRRAKRTTFVHCFQGASRSGLVVAAYLMREHRWSRAETIAFIRTKRPEMRPNPAFLELLGEWERVLRERG